MVSIYIGMISLVFFVTTSEPNYNWWLFGAFKQVNSGGYFLYFKKLLIVIIIYIINCLYVKLRQYCFYIGN